MYKVLIDGNWVLAKDAELCWGKLIYELADGRTGEAPWGFWREAGAEA